MKVLEYLEEQGHSLSARSGKPVDRVGNPLPWYTYPVIEYLTGIDWSGKRVFEYGSGNSSLFWAGRAGRVWSVEHDPAWYEYLAPRSPANLDVALREQRFEYVSHVANVGIQFDVIVVDGVYRLDCAQSCLACLAEDGVVILDNSDKYPETARYLREADLIQVDFTGLGPIVAFATTTSLFLTPRFRPSPAESRLPRPGVGALQCIVDPE